MTRSIKTLLVALTAAVALSHAAHAQNFQSSSYSQSWSSSSGSSWGVNADGTSYRNGYSNSNSELNASTTTGTLGLLGSQSNTTRVRQQQSTSTGFSQSSGPGGFQQSAYNNESGSLDIVNRQRASGLFGNVSDTQRLSAQYNNQSSIAQGIGPNGIYDDRYQSNSGSLSVGRRVRANSIFGPAIDAGSTRTVGFFNEAGQSQGLGSGGLYSNQFNNQNVTVGGNDFFRVFP